MRVVSNTYPIWNLASIRRLDLLREQWHEVLIPAEVLSELRMESGYPETDRIRAALDAQWIRMTPLTSSDLKRSLMRELDEGEAAAIALALECRLSNIIIDEADGRAAAKALGLRPTGVLGILLRAKREGRIPSVAHEMRQLRDHSGFFIAESLFQYILAEAGE